MRKDVLNLFFGDALASVLDLHDKHLLHEVERCFYRNYTLESVIQGILD